MMLLITKGWDEYQLLDSGEGRRLERYGAYVLDRPDPQCIWKTSQGSALWAKADAVFQRKDDREVWVTKSSIPSQWRISYKEISFLRQLKYLIKFCERGEADSHFSKIENREIGNGRSKLAVIYLYCQIAIRLIHF